MITLFSFIIAVTCTGAQIPDARSHLIARSHERTHDKHTHAILLASSGPGTRDLVVGFSADIDLYIHYACHIYMNTCMYIYVRVHGYRLIYFHCAPTSCLCAVATGRI